MSGSAPRALVTGSAGFIGRHMTTYLQDQGYVVDGLDIVGEHSSKTPVKTGGHRDALGFFRDRRQSRRYDLVVHCAYLVGGRAAIDGVNMNLAGNLELDSAMFKWAVRTQQRHVLYFSSSAVYPVCRQTRTAVEYAFSEDFGDRLNLEMGWGSHGLRLAEDEVNPLDPSGVPDAHYGWAKLTGERLADECRRHGPAVTVVRPFSGYGSDQALDYPFPSIVERSRRGDLSVWGPQGQTRDWIHVDDVVRGAMAVVANGTTDPVNLCTGIPTEMGDLARMIYGIDQNGHWPPGVGDVAVPPATYDEDKPTGVFYRVGDPRLLLSMYWPKISILQGVERALEK